MSGRSATPRGHAGDIVWNMVPIGIWITFVRALALALVAALFCVPFFVWIGTSHQSDTAKAAWSIGTFVVMYGAAWLGEVMRARRRRLDEKHPENALKGWRRE